MDERVNDMPQGLLATSMMMLVTYFSGTLWGWSDWLNEAWANVTSGQASIIMGVLTYLTCFGGKLVRGLSSMFSKARKYLP